MISKEISLFDLAERRLAWAERRQAVLAQNVANANTPGYKPRDLRPFSTVLSNKLAVSPIRTQPSHLAGTISARQSDEAIDNTRSQSPDRNGVGLEEQLVKVADTESTHAMVTAIYRKYLSLFSMALGRAMSG